MPSRFSLGKYVATLASLALIWAVVYYFSLDFAEFLSYKVFQLEEGTKLANSLIFFIYDSLKILLLMVAMIYVIGFLRASLDTERIRRFLVGKRSFAGYILATLFGAVTPFCSCSSVPLFIGFITARIPFGITMTFLITSPLINEVAVVVLWGLLGWKFTVVYVALGLSAGILGGLIMDKLDAQKWLQDFLKKDYGTNLPSLENRKMTVEDRHEFALKETKDIFKRVWRWVLVGVSAGALLYGYVPEGFIADNLSADKWWSVPLAVILGLPLYSSATGIIPVMESLIVKGLPIGTTLALSMSAITISFPELIMLKQAMKWQLLALFVGVMIVIFITIGYSLNFLAPLIF